MKLRRRKTREERAAAEAKKRERLATKEARNAASLHTGRFDVKARSFWRNGL